MTDVVVLDSGPLGMISHPRASAEIVEWLARLVGSGVEVLTPEVADYEVRRELLRAGRLRGMIETVWGRVSAVGTCSFSYASDHAATRPWSMS
jgi:hypothetical protein